MTALIVLVLNSLVLTYGVQNCHRVLQAKSQQADLNAVLQLATTQLQGSKRPAHNYDYHGKHYRCDYQQQTLRIVEQQTGDQIEIKWQKC